MNNDQDMIASFFQTSLKGDSYNCMCIQTVQMHNWLDAVNKIQS